MSLAGVRGAFVRELGYLRTHPWDAAMITWFPALAMIVAWAIFAPGVPVKLPVAFVDEDHSPGSRRVELAIDATRSSSIAARPATLEEAWPLVRSLDVYAIVHVPADWERRARRNDRLPVVLYTNEQFHAAGSTVSPDIGQAVASVVGESALAGLAHLGGGFNGAEWRAQAVRVELRTLFAPQLSFERVLAGMFLPSMLHMFVLGAAGYAIGREFRDRSAGEWMEASRGSVVAGLAGKLLPMMSVFVLMGLAIIAWFVGYRGWAAGGSIAFWCAGMVTLLLACCAIPAMFVGLTGGLRETLAVSAILNVTAISFAGLSYPLASMTTAAKVWAHLLPFKYYFDIQQQQWYIGSPLAVSLVPLAILWGVFIAVPLAIAIPKLRALAANPAAWGKR
jgi:ABC-2 type transport system permease protein